MRVVLACVLIALAAAEQARVIYYSGVNDTHETRETAMSSCKDRNEHIAHQSQMILDSLDGFQHEVCGWTWQRGKTAYVECQEFEDDEVSCKSGKAKFRKCPKDTETNMPTPSGVYCRHFSDEEDRPNFEIEDGDLIDIYRTPGPNGPNTLMNVDEAKAVCEGSGNTLAYWSQVSAYVDRYGIQICQHSWLREQNAVFNANCENNDEIGWEVRNSSRGYDAICYGHTPHTYKDPCAGDYHFPNLEGVPVYCSDDGYIIIQDRPTCDQEEYSFHKEWDDYEHGFGEFGLGYWFGLKYLAKITESYDFKLVIEVTDESDEMYVAEYGEFKVSNKEDDYSLNVGDYTEGEPNDAGNMLMEIQENGDTADGAKFSAIDQDRDNDGNNDLHCANIFGSGWWFQSCNKGNLNGACPGDEAYSVTYKRMRWWLPVSNNTAGLTRTRMKIKYTGSS